MTMASVHKSRSIKTWFSQCSLEVLDLTNAYVAEQEQIPAVVLSEAWEGDVGCDGNNGVHILLALIVSLQREREKSVMEKDCRG